MKYIVVPNSCRICLRHTSKLRSVYHSLEEGEESPREMLRLITGVTMEEDGTHMELPKSICKNCDLSLSLAFQFRKRALRSQNIINTFSKGLQQNKQLPPEQSPNKIKKELEDYIDLKEGMAEVNSYENELDITKYDDELNTTDVIKVELLDDFPYSEDNDNLDIDDYVEHTEYLEEPDPNDFDNEIVEVKTDDEGDLTMEQLNFEYTDVKQEFGPLDIHQTAQDRLENNVQPRLSPVRLKQRKAGKHVIHFNRISSTSKQKSEKTVKKDAVTTRNTRKSEEDCGHICDICGNIYAKRGRMMEHRRRHDTVPRFDCELCDEQFHLRENLRKHMFLHTGGKPYKCSFCSRTFFYESVKKAHEAVHSGVKPYKCEECDKSFAYAQALTKHKLIHADIKLFHCEYCDKDFRLQHHLKQHQETKFHQNTIRAVEEAARNVGTMITKRKTTIIPPSLKSNLPLV